MALYLSVFPEWSIRKNIRLKNSHVTENETTVCQLSNDGSPQMSTAESSIIGVAARMDFHGLPWVEYIVLIFLYEFPYFPDVRPRDGDGTVHFEEMEAAL